MNSKLIGSILLIVGTSLGAGMLALPIATAALGFLGAIILMFCVWAAMTLGALYILEVNLWLPQNSNLISMAKVTIGPVGQIIAWVTFLLLLYSLQSAYIAGGSDLLHNLILIAGLDLPRGITAIGFTLLLGGIVYLGIRTIDYANRMFMSLKMGAYLLLVVLLLPFVSVEKLGEGSMQHITTTTAIMVTITAFGYAAIVPSLRIYFKEDTQSLKRAIIYGSILSLLCYTVWVLVVMGVLPLDGEQSLTAILNSENSTSSLSNALSNVANQGVMTFIVKLFTSVAVVTSFLGVALCLSDFLADGLQLEKRGKSQRVLYAVTFLPSLVIVLFKPDIFVQALEYAGYYCIVLLMLLPAWMAMSGRYYRKVAKTGYRVPGGIFALALLFIISIGLLVKALF